MTVINSTPKSPELLLAQVSAFVAESFHSMSDRSLVLRQIGDLSLDSLVVNKVKVNHFDVHYDDYASFLREKRGSKYEPIEKRAEILMAYREFAPTVRNLKESVDGSEIMSDCLTYIGGGAFSNVFRVEHEGEQYAVRLVKNGIGRMGPSVAETIDNHLAGAILVKGVPHFEQIAAASYSEGVTVAQKLPGKNLNRLYVADIEKITDVQLEEFVDTIITAHKFGIRLDPMPTNVIYDETEGFGVVDFDSRKIISKVYDNSISKKISSVAGIIASSVIGGVGQVERMHSDMLRGQMPVVSTSNQAIYWARVGLLERYGFALSSRLSAADFYKAEPIINETISRIDKLIMPSL